MPNGTLTPLEVDEVQITTIMDNTIDLFMAPTEVARRYPVGENPFDKNRTLPYAEHGFSVVIRFKRGDRSGSVLFDTGVTRKGLLNNFDAMGVDAKDFQAVILSHGHPDHALGFEGLADRLGARNVPLVIHPDAYLERKLVLPNGSETFLPAPKRADFERVGIQIIEEVGPSMLVEGMLLVSGEVGRTTAFEKGFPIHYALHEHGWEPDPLIHDDQCAVMNVKGKGLIIVSGCGHSGIVNIIWHAQQLTGISKVYAVMGGFHLTGRLFEPIILQTVTALKEMNPRWLIPGHCTGWMAVREIQREMPDAFIPNSVGTTLML